MLRHAAAASFLGAIAIVSAAYAQPFPQPLVQPPTDAAGTAPTESATIPPAQTGVPDPMGGTGAGAATLNASQPMASTQPPVTENPITPTQPLVAAPTPVSATDEGVKSDTLNNNGSKPLLVIRFNQNHVYFAHSMEQAIRSAEAAKAGVAYSVVNFVPAAPNRPDNDRVSGTASYNLQAVLNEMQTLGVTPDRITVETEAAPKDVTNQEIQIFVR